LIFGPAETRPDFAAIIYGAREIKEVPSPAPPLFLAVAADDAMAVGRTIDLFTAYRKAKGQAELHVFQMGAHGFLKKGGGADRFMDRLEEWLAVNKLLSHEGTGIEEIIRHRQRRSRMTVSESGSPLMGIGSSSGSSKSAAVSGSWLISPIARRC
jgi:hypothetical protein